MPMTPRPLADRFWPKVDKTDSCWLWTRAVRRDGYGEIRGEGGRGSRTLAAHIVAYVWEMGPIPAGLQLDHLCRVRRCVRPSHMEPVTAAVNTLRGVGPATINAAKTHCPSGHPYAGDNLHLKYDRRWLRPTRVCLTCRRSQQNRRYHARRVA